MTDEIYALRDKIKLIDAEKKEWQILANQLYWATNAAILYMGNSDMDESQYLLLRNEVKAAQEKYIHLRDTTNQKLDTNLPS